METIEVTFYDEDNDVRLGELVNPFRADAEGVTFLCRENDETILTVVTYNDDEMNFHEVYAQQVAGLRLLVL